jgi:anti-anti-sigma factor
MSPSDGPVLDVEVRQSADGVEVVALRGELDFASTDKLSSALAGLSNEPRRVVVDLSGLEFIDSSGVRMLMTAARAIEDSGGRLVLCAPTVSVQAVFEILHVPEVVTVLPDLETALEQAASVPTRPASGDG